MSVFVDYLKKIRVPADVIAKLTEASASEEKPEGFDIEKLADSYRSEQEQLFIAKNKDAIISEYDEATKKEKYLSAVVPIQNRIKKLGNFTKEEVEGKDPKELLDLWAEKVEAQVQKASGEGNEELLQKINDWQKKYHSLSEETEVEAAALKEAIEKERQRADEKIQTFQVDTMLAGKYNNKQVVEFDDYSKINAYSEFVSRHLKENYTIKPDGTLLSKDGTTQAVWGDGEKIIKNVDEAIKLVSEKYNLVKRSNGGEQSLNVPQGVVEIKGKKVNHTSANALAEMLK